ncbi:hypothetical protein [Streptomyces sp. HC307]|uniref:hypothetical protein n=1 Tax=Streptomyces flavusporus TaxID=3385496 RepID=UPI0039174451
MPVRPVGQSAVPPSSVEIPLNVASRIKLAESHSQHFIGVGSEQFLHLLNAGPKPFLGNRICGQQNCDPVHVEPQILFPLQRTVRKFVIFDFITIHDLDSVVETMQVRKLLQRFLVVPVRLFESILGNQPDEINVIPAHSPVNLSLYIQMTVGEIGFRVVTEVRGLRKNPPDDFLIAISEQWPKIPWSGNPAHASRTQGIGILRSMGDSVTHMRLQPENHRAIVGCASLQISRKGQSRILGKILYVGP